MLLFGACSDGKPGTREALSQIQTLFKQSDDVVAIKSLQYVNGFQRNRNNYVVSVRFTTVFKKSLEDLKTSIDQEPNLQARIGGALAVFALGWKYRDFRSGDSFEEEGDARFLKTEKGWILQNWESGPSVVAKTSNRRMDDELQQAWKELSEGRIAYEPARSMTEGYPENIVVRVARGDVVDTQSGFVDRAWVERLKVSGFMSASLTGAAGDFEIVPLSSEGQALVGPSSDWLWRVTPLRGGDLALHLRVTARIRLSDGTSENHDLLVKTAQISVRANPRWRVGRFWRQNWQWILGSPIVLGVLGWLGARVLKRKRAGHPIGFGR